MSYRYWKAKIEWFIDTIRYKEVDLDYAKSSWPWWQNVNKRETKVQLSRDANSSTTLPEPYKSRLLEQNATLITEDWILRIDTQVHRTQEANKELTQKKLATIIKNAFKEPKVRKKTEPPKHVIDARIAEKKRRSKIRQSRNVLKFYE
jgi:ribosome-associated protein